MSQQHDVAIQLLDLQARTAFDHGVDLVGRSIQLVGVIDEEMFRLVDTALNLLERDSKATVTFKINSQGGSVYDAMAIIGRMRSSKCKIVTEGYGSVMSAATLILAAGDKRRISELSWVMWHESSYDVGGTHTQVKHFSQQVDREDKMWVQMMAKLTLATADFWQNKGQSGKDFYLNAKECLELGIVDEII